MTTAESIRSFIIENFLFGDTSQDLGDDVSLIEADLVDSTGVLEVVAHLESTYGIKVDDAELLPENLDSIARIAAFVEKKKG